ncbi:hypothetical protein BGW38_008428 [Lunasporangiospora selenospora]|uniref:YbaK/aminoacyl-tRNA synthetase-associated domain-containing protein n=1 Tax=Lunasporangiospora selenospora TaxID=979761 RepID=A0A9P6G2B3_9FUNG|nr:hypothetical protein BGW38_008428 [Lunasporangiospora selenospora]
MTDQEKLQQQPVESPAAPSGTGAGLRTQLMADVYHEPVCSLDDFLDRAKQDVMPDNIPEATMQIYNDAKARLGDEFRFFHVASDYYSWPFEQRIRVMAAPSTFHLCKTLVLENTKHRQDETKPLDQDRYWCVIVQYEAAVNITKLEKAVREWTGASRKAMHLRVAPAEKSLELTGFENGAVSPIGLRTDLPIVLSSSITELSPPLLYLGAGHVDWKVALSVQSFVEKWNVRVVDFA